MHTQVKRFGVDGKPEYGKPIYMKPKCEMFVPTERPSGMSASQWIEYILKNPPARCPNDVIETISAPPVTEIYLLNFPELVSKKSWGLCARHAAKLRDIKKMDANALFGTPQEGTKES